MLGVTIPGTHLEKPGAISSSLAAQRLLDCSIDQDAGDGRILRSGADELGMLMSPHFQIDIEHIGRDYIGGRAELALRAALHVVWHRRKPNIDVQAHLMALVFGEHRPAAGLRHVADQQTVPANLFRVLGKPFDKADELRIAPVAVTRRPARQPSKYPPIERGGPGNGVDLRANSSLASVDGASGFCSGGSGSGLREPGGVGSIKCFSRATAEPAAARRRTASN
jgi:hypothetical protein